MFVFERSIYERRCGRSDNSATKRPRCANRSCFDRTRAPRRSKTIAINVIVDVRVPWSMYCSHGSIGTTQSRRRRTRGKQCDHCPIDWHRFLTTFSDNNDDDDDRRLMRDEMRSLLRATRDLNANGSFFLDLSLLSLPIVHVENVDDPDCCSTSLALANDSVAALAQLEQERARAAQGSVRQSRPSFCVVFPAVFVVLFYANILPKRTLIVCFPPSHSRSTALLAEQQAAEQAVRADASNARSLVFRYDSHPIGFCLAASSIAQRQDNERQLLARAAEAKVTNTAVIDTSIRNMSV
jgi:hypothetical protein